MGSRATSSDRSTVARTAVVTMVAGGLVFLVSSALDQPRAIGITLSIVVGGITLLVRFLIEFEQRLAVVERQTADGIADLKQLVGGAFSEISEATALFGLIEASALQTDLVTQLVRNSTQISPASPPIVYAFVQAKIKETSEFLKQLAEGGTVTYYGEDRDWLLGLTRNATAGIDAISSTAVDHALWDSEIGQRYLDAQRRVAAAGVRVRRLFLVEHPDRANDPELQRICAEHRRMMIEVRVLDRASVPPPLRVQVRDLIVFDDTVAYETTPTSGDERVAQVAETRLVLTGSRVKECALLFRELWEAARENA